jgi:hypothetical protein
MELFVNLSAMNLCPTLFFSITETFISAAEAYSNDILKLYAHNGNLLAISNNLAANTLKDPYRLEIIVKSVVDHGNDLKQLVSRIENLEYQLSSFSDTGESKRVDKLNFKLKDLCQKLEVQFFLFAMLFS